MSRQKLSATADHLSSDGYWFMFMQIKHLINFILSTGPLCSLPSGKEIRTERTSNRNVHINWMRLIRLVSDC